MSDLENVYLHLKSISPKVPLKNCSYHTPSTQRLFLCFISMLDISMPFFMLRCHIQLCKIAK